VPELASQPVLELSSQAVLELASQPVLVSYSQPEPLSQAVPKPSSQAVSESSSQVVPIQYLYRSCPGLGFPLPPALLSTALLFYCPHHHACLIRQAVRENLENGCFIAFVLNDGAYVAQPHFVGHNLTLDPSQHTSSID